MKITHHANFILFGSTLSSVATLFWLSEACKGEVGWSWRDVCFHKKPPHGKMQGTDGTTNVILREVQKHGAPNLVKGRHSFQSEDNWY